MLVDIIVAAVVIISAIISFLRGFIREVLTIAGVVGGIAAAWLFGSSLAPTFRGWFGVEENLEEGEKVAKLFDLIPMDIVANVCAYASIFVVVVILISVLSHFTAGAIKAMGLGPVDRSLGVIFGIARAIILLGLLYLPFYLSEIKTDLFEDSKTHYLIEKTSIFLAGFLPNAEEVEEKIEKVADEKLKDKLLEQDLLKGADDLKEKVMKATDKKEEGYQDEQREELEMLFEEKAPEIQKPTLNE